MNAITQDREGMLWIGTKHGLNRFERKTGIWTCYAHDPNDKKSLSDDNVQSVVEDRDGILWVGTAKGGLNRFDRKTGTFVHYKNDPDNPHSIGADYVFYIYEDRSGRLWLCHLDMWGKAGHAAFSILDKETGTFVRHAHDPDNPNSVSSHSIKGVYEDTETGIFWISNSTAIVDKYDKNALKFGILQHDPKNSNSLSQSGVSEICEGSDGILWFGTGYNGLNRFDRKTGMFTRYLADPDDPDSLSSPWVGSILEDSSGTFWLGNAGMLVIFDRETGKVVRRYEHDPDDPDSFTRCKGIRYLIEDRDNPDILWISTHGGGLDKFDKKRELFTHYRHDPDNPDSLSHDIMRTI